jgi:hypothetical protein
MKKLILLSAFIPVCLFAQVADDFSDGDFTQNPAWTGDTGHFKLSSSTAVPQDQRPALQLDAPAAGLSSLSVSHALSGELEWHFWTKLSLNTSSGNYARLYLFSDKADLKTPLHGYFLQVGGQQDSVIFFRQDSLETSRLLRMSTAFTGNSTNALRFKVTRSAEGTWKFYCDELGGNSMVLQGECNDPAFPQGNHFGLFCQYSSSNTSKFYFDDIYAGPLIIDSVPPVLIRIKTVNPSELLLTFNEPTEKESAENVDSYEIIPGVGHPYEAVRLLDPAQVHLFFDEQLESGQQYILNISSVKDLAGNESGPLAQPVWYYRVQPYDLLITEIMADPTPPRELPEYEYLEIYNRSPLPLNVEGLRLKISSSEQVLPLYFISPGDYVLICDDDDVEIMQHIAPSIGIPSFSLSNTGSTLQIIDESGRIIHYLEYSDSWYHNNIKSEGGWSLEMIDPENPCKAGENWTASVSAEGGTPGKVNAVNAQLISDLKIIKTCCINERSLLVSFSESPDSLAATDIARYRADPFLGNPDSAFILAPDFLSVRLVYNQGFTPGRLYSLEISQGLQNCVGEELTTSLVSPFAMSGPAEPFDLLINEVLFNPLGDGVDYVEIYNPSNKTIDLEGMILASVKSSPMELPDTQVRVITSSCMAVFPGQYLVLTSDPDMVKSQFFAKDPDAFLKMPSFPSYNNDKGTVLLKKPDGTVVDGMDYQEEMHFLMLLSYDGVALERISPERTGNDPSNWHSAAETAGFGTPGYKNSQFLENHEEDDAFTLRPEVFSPDGDGKDDNLGIFYHFETPGKLVTVLIFDSFGRPARTLVNNEMPGTGGLFSWDGTLNDRTPARDGIYIVYMEALGMDGKTKRFKKAAALARSR